MPQIPGDKPHKTITYLTPIKGETFQQMLTRSLLERWTGPLTYFMTPGVPVKPKRTDWKT